ncbi:DUF4019 domain-containing protein [Lysobacter sp. FW306-1B-D06B]|uniref:DUF4019 domain-containing protein n=1 Tax=Lysobacter sp. FW306-1B-D06B TaxID=3140250 RepID=UPI00313FF80D
MCKWLGRLMSGDKPLAPTIGAAIGPVPLEPDSPAQLDHSNNDDSKGFEVAPELISDHTDANELVKAALELAQLMGTNQVGQAWDQASPVMKRVIGRATFLDTVTAQRGSYGALTERRWASVSRYTVEASAQTPPGAYANVEFEVRFANRKVGREMVAFHLDERGTWRFSGYAITHPPAEPAVQYEPSERKP